MLQASSLINRMFLKEQRSVPPGFTGECDASHTHREDILRSNIQVSTEKMQSNERFQGLPGRRSGFRVASDGGAFFPESKVGAANRGSDPSRTPPSVAKSWIWPLWENCYESGNEIAATGVSSMETRRKTRKQGGSIMFCSQCGQAVGAQPRCPNCGAPTGVAGGMPPFVPAAVPPGYPRALPLALSRVARHLHTLGVLWTVFAAYSVLRWLLVLPFLHMALGGGRWMSGSDAWMMSSFHPGGWLLHFITIVVFARAILSVAVGLALLTRQPWGRIFAIIIAVLTLLKPFLGTILAIYTLWIMLETSADQNYAQLSAERHAFPPPAPPM